MRRALPVFSTPGTQHNPHAARHRQTYVPLWAQKEIDDALQRLNRGRSPIITWLTSWLWSWTIVIPPSHPQFTARLTGRGKIIGVLGHRMRFEQLSRDQLSGLKIGLQNL